MKKLYTGDRVALGDLHRHNILRFRRPQPFQALAENNKEYVSTEIPNMIDKLHPSRTTCRYPTPQTDPQATQKHTFKSKCGLLATLLIGSQHQRYLAPNQRITSRRRGMGYDDRSRGWSGMDGRSGGVGPESKIKRTTKIAKETLSEIHTQRHAQSTEKNSTALTGRGRR